MLHGEFLTPFPLTRKIFTSVVFFEQVLFWAFKKSDCIFISILKNKWNNLKKYTFAISKTFRYIFAIRVCENKILLKWCFQLCWEKVVSGHVNMYAKRHCKKIPCSRWWDWSIILRKLWEAESNHVLDNQCIRWRKKFSCLKFMLFIKKVFQGYLWVWVFSDKWDRFLTFLPGFGYTIPAYCVYLQALSK